MLKSDLYQSPSVKAWIPDASVDMRSRGFLPIRARLANAATASAYHSQSPVTRRFRPIQANARSAFQRFGNVLAAYGRSNEDAVQPFVLTAPQSEQRWRNSPES